MAGKSGRNVKYAVQEDPAFIKRFKEKIGYKEDPGIEEKVLLSYAPSALCERLQASSDRECPMCLQRHLSNILKYFLGYRSRTLTLNPKP